MAVMFFFVNAALFFNSYVNPVALGDISWKYYIVYDIWLFVELIFVYFVSFLFLWLFAPSKLSHANYCTVLC